MSLNGVAEIDKALDLLSRASARSFLKIWASAPSSEKAALIEYLTPNLLALIEAGHEEASTLALEQLNWQRAGAKAKIHCVLFTPVHRWQQIVSLCSG